MHWKIKNTINFNLQLEEDNESCEDEEGVTGEERDRVIVVGWKLME